MKLTKTLAIGIAALGFSAVALAEDIKINVPGGSVPAVTAPVAKAPAPASFSEAQVLEQLGWMAAKSMQLDIFKFSPVQFESVVKGIAQAAGGKDMPYDQEKIGALVQESPRKQAEFMNAVKIESQKESAAYFVKLKDNKAVIELPSGLRYEIVQPGTGAFPKASESVKVHYTGTLVDGTVFDSSVERKEPVEFALDRVIPGWTEGIQKINKGGKIRLHVPANLAYGDEGRPGIPPGAALIFDVELLEIKPTPGPASIAPTK